MRIYNTLSRQKEEFVPLEPGKVRIYACGPTVYNFIHIGNARPICVFDVLRRYLEYRGYDVTFVQNFTDIDDKLIKKANEEGITVAEVAERYIAEYKKDAEGLGVRPATVHPRATEVVDKIIEIVSHLVEKGYAYESNGDVYFRVHKFEDYGKLSPLKIWRPAAVSMSAKSRRIRWTLHCGRQPSRVNPTGSPPGARAVRAGTLSAPR